MDIISGSEIRPDAWRRDGNKLIVDKQPVYEAVLLADRGAITLQ